MSKATKWRELAVCDDCELTGEIMQLGDMVDAWQDYGFSDGIDINADFILHCDHLLVTSESYDGGPGSSGSTKFILSDDPAAMRAELRTLMARMIRGRLDDVRSYRDEQRGIERRC